MDVDGYPTGEEIERIRAWSYADPGGLMEFIRTRCWNHDYGKIEQNGRELRLVTGGWSGNEEVIRALGQTPMFDVLYWQSSHRGGLHVYKIPA